MYSLDEDEEGEFAMSAMGACCRHITRQLLQMLAAPLPGFKCTREKYSTKGPKKMY